MTIQLSAERERFVKSLVAEGKFTTEEAVVEAALRLLQQQEQADAATLARLRRDIGEAIEEADRGELEPFDAHATLALVRARRATGSP
jgi:putative addiction module CopG family antidote